MKFDHLTNRLWRRRLEEVPEGCLVEQRGPDDPQHIEGASVQPEVMLKNGDQAVCDDGDIYLDADGVFRRSPERVDPEVRLQPLEKALDQPAILIKEGDGLGLEGEVVRKERKCPFMLRRVVHDTTKCGRIVVPGLLSGEPDGLVEKDVALIGHFIVGCDDLILHSPLLPDDEVGRYGIDRIEPFEVVISSVEDVVSKWFIGYSVHRVHICDLGVGNVDIDGYLRDDVKQRMRLDACLRLSEVGPGEKAQAEVYRGRVKSIELPIQLERASDAFSLGDGHHMIGKLFKYSIIPSGVGGREVPETELRLAEAQMIALAPVGICYAHELPETVASGKLSVHRHHKMVPAAVPLDVLVSAVLLDYAVEYPLGQHRRDLAEDIGSRIHYRPFDNRSVMIRNQIDTRKLAA